MSRRMNGWTLAVLIGAARFNSLPAQASAVSDVKAQVARIQKGGSIYRIITRHNETGDTITAYWEPSGLRRVTVAKADGSTNDLYFAAYGVTRPADRAVLIFATIGTRGEPPQRAVFRDEQLLELIDEHGRSLPVGGRAMDAWKFKFFQFVEALTRLTIQGLDGYGAKSDDPLAGILKLSPTWVRVERGGGEVLNPELWRFVQDSIPRIDYADLHRITDGAMYGFIDRTGKEVVPPRLPWASDVGDGFLVVRVTAAPWVTEAVDCIVDTRGTIQFGCVKAPRPGMDRTNALNIPREGRWIFDRHVVNARGELVEGFSKKTGYSVASAVSDFREGFIPIINGSGDLAFADSTGRPLLQPQFRAVGPFSGSLAAVQVFGKWGFIDRTGKLAIQPQWETATNFHGGSAIVNSCGAMINTTGVIVASLLRPHPTTKEPIAKYLYCTDGSYSDGLWRLDVSSRQVGSDDLVAFLDGSGHEVLRVRSGIAKTPAGVGVFSEGLAPITNFDTQRTGYMDRAGRIVIPTRFEKVSLFDRGLALVVENGRPGYIDRTGTYVWRQPLVR